MKKLEEVLEKSNISQNKKAGLLLFSYVGNLIKNNQELPRIKYELGVELSIQMKCADHILEVLKKSNLIYFENTFAKFTEFGEIFYDYLNTSIQERVKDKFENLVGDYK